MNKKSFLSLLLSILFIGTSSSVYAADSKVLFAVDCNTLNKDLLVGFQSDPADPANGEEIIAFEFTMSLEPISGSVIADLANAKFEANTSISNMIVAQNTSNTVGNKRELKIAGGLTQQTGLNNVADLLSITGVNQKPYKVTVTDGKLFPKSGGDDIYTDTAPKKTFTADPSSCQSGTTTTTPPAAQQGLENVVIENFAFTPSDITIEVGEIVKWTNSDTAPHTVTSVGGGGLASGNLQPGQSYQKTFTEVGTFDYQCTIHPSMTGRVIVTAASASPADNGSNTGTSGSDPSASSSDIGITLSSDKDTANPGDDVVVTAVITNLSGAIDWSQTEGTRIQPNISNEAVTDTETKSTLSFTMPTPATNVTLRVKVADTTETITINGADNATAAAAGTDNTPADTTATDTGADTQSLQERLEQRRQEQEAAANPSAVVTTQPTGTLHGAAGAGLARSGPEHTLALVLAAAFMAYVFRRKNRKGLDSV